MKFLEQWFSSHKDLHHAHLLFGDYKNLLNELELFFENTLGFSIHGNPDYSKTEFSTFGIDDARSLNEIARRKDFLGNRTIIVVNANSFTTESQNSLLKLFEDPVQGVHFFIITSSDTFLLPTLISRLLLVGGQDSLYEPDMKNAERFVTSSIAERQEILLEYFDSKDKISILNFLNDIESYLMSEIHGGKIISAETLKSIMVMRGYILDRSSSLKMILDHLSTMTFA
jgi:hypothetical protein